MSLKKMVSVNTVRKCISNEINIIKETIKCMSTSNI